MARIILRRLAALPFVVLSVTFLTFIVGYLAPGDPILALMGNNRDPKVYANLRHLYGLDLPWWEQYLNYLNGLLHGNLGLSYRYAQRPVTQLLAGGVSVSFRLGLTALICALLVGIPLGTFAGLRRNSLADRAVMAPMLALYAIPSFVLIPALQWLNYRAYNRGLPSLPAAGWGTWQHWVLPVIVLMAASLGYISRLTRASVVEVMGQDYVRTARGKGLPERLVRLRHILRNAMLPVVTV
ncbi:MAG: ABC transporter permease, partial [Thermomicrobiales bacterium]